MIKLSYRKVFNKSPGLATVSCNSHPPIITINHKIRIIRMYPPGMVIGMDLKADSKSAEGFSSIFAYINARMKAVYTVFIFWINIDFSIIKGSPANVSITRFPPGKTSVIRAIDCILFRFNVGIYNVRFTSCNG